MGGPGSGATYYHWWRAYVDDRPAPLLQANYAFQAVEVPAGRHHVRLAYEDRKLRVGAAISLSALLTCMVLWVLSRGSRDVAGPQTVSGSKA